MNVLHSTIGGIIVAVFMLGLLVGYGFSRQREDAETDDSHADKLDYPTDADKKTSVAALARAQIALAKDKQAADHRADAHHKKTYTVSYWTAIGVAVYTGLTALITGASIWSASTATDSEHRQLRAYIFIDHATMMDFELGKKPQVKFAVKNFGQTPGYETVIDLWIALTDPKNPEFDNSGHPGPPSPLAPGYTMRSILTASDVLDESTNAAVENGSLAYFVYGTITYKDTFGRDHWTKARAIFGATELALGGGGLTLYREGNDADRDP